MIVRTPRTPSYAPARVAACGMRGLGCAGNCAACPANTVRPTRPTGGMGAFYDTWPAPLNNPLILLAIAAAVLLIFGGGLGIMKRKKGSNAGQRNRLRLAQAKADLERAQILSA
jgi:hypothetical protein